MNLCHKALNLMQASVQNHLPLHQLIFKTYSDPVVDADVGGVDDARVQDGTAAGNIHKQIDAGCSQTVASAASRGVPVGRRGHF